MRTTVFTACLLAMSAVAFAQSRSDIECKKSETQPECFARLKCKPTEELEDCQKRLRAEAAANGNANSNSGQGGQTTNDTSDRDNGGDRGRTERDRGDSDRDRDHSDRGGRDRDGSDRGERRSEYGGHRRRGGGGGGTHGGFEANKTFGLGLELGEPTGLNGKLFLSPRGALDFGIGAIYDDYYYGNGLHLYLDYLWHPALLAATPSFELPFYIGVGGRFWSFDYCYMGVCSYSGTAVGIRVPFGIDFDFNNVPLDIFLQLVPVLDFVSGDYYTRYGDRTHFGLDASVGIRFWFK